MNIKLIAEPDSNKTSLEQILNNRGIYDIENFIHPTIDVVNEPDALGEQSLLQGLRVILKTMQTKQRMAVIVDCDVDGFTSSAFLLNYLYATFPHYAENYIQYFFHKGKSHGLNEFIDDLQKSDFKLVVTPDSASNDYSAHARLKDVGISVLVLDHHLADKISEDAIIINNQLSDYPNKQLSGVGVVWQFCRAFDALLGVDNTSKLLDLVALGLTGDMMSLTSLETNALIHAGFSEQFVYNKFIREMIKKNNYSLEKPKYKSYIPGQAITPIGATFFIVPFINAVNRSGTQEEKKLIFDALLTWKCDNKIPSTKRGHAAGEEETVLEQALRTITNIKNRQTTAQTSAMEKIKKKIATDNLDDHSVIVVEITDEEVKPEIRGLVANKIMAEYQKPVCVVAEVTNEQGDKILTGSMRGYTKTGIDNFKEVCQQSGKTQFVQGHENAAGIAIKSENKQAFLEETDKKISTIASHTGVVHRVDYLFTENDLPEYLVMEIAQMNDLWGQDVERAYIGVRMKVTPYNFTVMKSNTLRINLSNGMNAIKFSGTEQEIKRLTIQQGYLDIMAYCECNINSWLGQDSGQLIINDYEIMDAIEYDF